jgi:hypothetical protein
MRYVPILKGKEGEFAALEELTPNILGKLTPLIEVPDIPFDFINERPSKTLEAHVVGIAERLAKAWTNGGDAYVQLPWCEKGRPADERLQSKVHVFARVLADCEDEHVRAIPVISTASSDDYVAAAGAYIARTGVPLCIRLTLTDFDEDRQDAPLEDTLSNLLENANAGKAEGTDVIIDLREIDSDSTIVARAVSADLPAMSFRHRVIAAASFPENLSDVARGSVQTLPRHEWSLWERLRSRPPFRNAFSFGDYGISNPTTTELDPRTMRMSASIRYTTLNDWLVLKGKNVRDYGFDQYHELCKELVDRPEYRGRKFSWGDQFIYDCAHRVSGPGNATTWRKVGTNHHLTVVVNALANPVGS